MSVTVVGSHSTTAMFNTKLKEGWDKSTKYFYYKVKMKQKFQVLGHKYKKLLSSVRLYCAIIYIVQFNHHIFIRICYMYEKMLLYYTLTCVHTVCSQS